MRSCVFRMLVYCSLLLRLQYWLLGLLRLQLSPLHLRLLFQQRLLLREEEVVVFIVTIVVRRHCVFSMLVYCSLRLLQYWLLGLLRLQLSPLHLRRIFQQLLF